MRRVIQYILIAFFLGYYVACAPVRFEKDPEINKCQNFAQNCLKAENLDVFDYNLTVGGMVDILFINDNSGSMSFEQKHMAERFNRFLEQLDNKKIDYRIGMITTDISNGNATTASYNPARAINNNGALQDGKLVSFSDNSVFLTPATQNKESLFTQAIQRVETSTCESYMKTNADTAISDADYNRGVFDNCPSGDERPIAAATKFLNQNPDSFIRATAHLAIVVLSDEDERSSLYSGSPNYLLAPEDLPQTLVQNLRKTYGSKSMSIHSIIVNPGQLASGETPESVAEKISQVSSGKNADPRSFFTGGDSSCLNAQSNQLGIQNAKRTVRGSYGYLVALASKMTDGVVGDICANDYTSQLQNIGANISERTNEVQLACADPKELSVTLVDGTPVENHIEGTLLKFSSGLPALTTIHIQYKCIAL